MAWTWIRSALADVLRPWIAPHRMRVQSVNGCQRVVCLARVRVRATRIKTDVVLHRTRVPRARARARDPRAMGWVPREGEEQRARG